MLSAYSLVNRRNLQYQLCDKFDQMTSFRTMKLFEARTWHPKPRRTSEIFGFNRTVRPIQPAKYSPAAGHLINSLTTKCPPHRFLKSQISRLKEFQPFRFLGIEQKVRQVRYINHQIYACQVRDQT
jgi:hypothetical protein